MKKSLSFFYRFVILFFIYFSFGMFGLGISPVNTFASFVWPATGIAMAALLTYGARLWPAIALGAFFVNLFSGAPVLTAIGITIGNTLESVIAFYLLKHLVKFENSFERLSDALGFIIFGALLSTFASASIGVASLWLTGIIATPAINSTLSAWWIGDILGALLITPLILTWWHRKPKVEAERLGETLALGFVLTGIGSLVFWDFFPATFQSSPLFYLIFIPIIWAALRFSPRATVTNTFILSIIAVWGTIHGFGPFAKGAPPENLLFLQTFIGIVTITGIILAVVMAERKYAGEELETRIHELALAKAEVDQEEAKYEALLVSIGDGIVATDRNKKIIVVNSAFEKMFGISAKAANGKHTKELIPIEKEDGTPIPETERPLAQAITSGNKITMTAYVVRRNKSRFPALITATPLILAGNISGGIEVLRDVTKELEIDRAKSEFVALASHQLRTPLVTVNWFAGMLLKEEVGPLAVKQKNYLKKIVDANARLIELVNDLLSVSRIELGTFTTVLTPTDVAAVAEQSIKDLTQQWTIKNIELKKKYQSPMPRVEGDPTLLSMIFSNLLSNAIKYTPKGGTITFELKAEPQKLLIRVSDTGYGIPESEKSLVFTKFFRGNNIKDKEPDGTGLGLYIVKSIIEHVNGEIDFTSQLKKGTTFTIALPFGRIEESKTETKT